MRESKGEPKEVPKSYLESYQEKCVRGGRGAGQGRGVDGEGMRGGEAISLLRSHEWFLLWSLALPQLVLVHISIAPLSMPTPAA